jgi:hypothetical protein
VPQRACGLVHALRHLRGALLRGALALRGDPDLPEPTAPGPRKVCARITRVLRSSGKRAASTPAPAWLGVCVARAHASRS